VHEAHTVGGVGAEVLAAVAESGVTLRSPPVRVGAPPARVPAAPVLAQAIIPSTDVIADAIAKAMH
jgi:acetoin:2,6-dichlorophenolindophenol oxidoreductase subunit beta